MRILVTGGAGFIGSHLCNVLLKHGHQVTCYDQIDSRAVNPFALTRTRHAQFRLICGSIMDTKALAIALQSHDLVVHAAAQSAVDRSIKEPFETMMINGMGTVSVLEAMRSSGVRRIHYVSTDEVFGVSKSAAFNESSPMAPTNPYSAGKAAGESAILAWCNTYKLDFTITNGVNNYGPYQAPEKLIPRLTIRALLGKKLPVYGDGTQLREWLHVEDHCKAILKVIQDGKLGERYCIGGAKEKNINIVYKILSVLELDASRIEFVDDRPGHDIEYTVDDTKIRTLSWKARISLSTGIRNTVLWYRRNPTWWQYFLESSEI